MPQVWIKAEAGFSQRAGVLLRASSVHVDGDSGSGEEESCREESEGFLNWPSYRHQTVRAIGRQEGDGRNSKVMVLSNTGSSDSEQWDDYEGRQRVQTWLFLSICCKKQGIRARQLWKKKDWAQIVRRCWKAVLIYWKAFSTWPSLETDPRIFHREADKSPISNQGMLFNLSISFEMFHCLLVTTGVTILLLFWSAWNIFFSFSLCYTNLQCPVQLAVQTQVII